MFIPLLSPPASAWLISNSPIVLISATQNMVKYIHIEIIPSS
nr:hypothetical protein [Clostridium perfringens]